MSDQEGVDENDIAIVGMALRVPGANSPDEFWNNLINGTESIRDLDEETLLNAGESKSALRNPAYVRRAGALDRIKLFDRDFFGFSPREASILDPQHRHFMELCWESLEDAGHVPERFDGPIGVFAGCGMGSYFYFNVCSNPDLIDSVGLFLLRHTGNDKDFLSTRASYVLDLRGPSINVQTACSTSLVATHLACQSLLSGECDMALAGGVTINFPNETGYIYREGEVLSPDGVCRAFDARAQGTVLTSGGGVVTLRRLEDAIKDGDPIYAVIKGSAVNNDGGQKVGYLAPSVDGQVAAMSEAYALADIEPATIGLIECHGTGTYMGDPIEIAALTQAFRASTQETEICRIGSVKTNIGHLDTAAGVVGLIKAALSVQHAQMPASLNFENPNPEIGFENTPFIVNTDLRDWESGDTPRRAAVNSLGVGGTNVHMIIEEVSEIHDRAADTPSNNSSEARILLQFAARSNAALDGACSRLAEHLRNHPEEALKDVAYSLALTRAEMSRRRVLVAIDRDEAIELLEQNDPRRVFTHTVPEARSSTVFLFSGGGTQYPGMARGLCANEPIFRSHIERGLALYRERTGFDLSSLVLCATDAEEHAEAPLGQTSRQLPAIFIIEYAMVQLLASKGIEPQLLIGHSMGENAAACIAGVLSYEDCLDLLILRGTLVDRTPDGGMLAVSLPAADLQPYLEAGCELATINAPGLCVVSGGRSDIDALEKRFEEDEIDSRRVPIGRAGHSKLLDSVLEEFRDFMEGIELKPPTIPIISNRTAQILTDEEATSPDYWVKHLRNTVRFSEGLTEILEIPGRILIEVGPGQSLSSYARQQSAQGNTANIISTLRHRADPVQDGTFFISALGRFWAAGGEIELSILHSEKSRRVRLPTYAWDHQSYFIDRLEPTLEHVDSQLPERLEDLSEWGFEPAWNPASLDTRRIEGNQTWLLFMDHAGIGSRLAKRLESDGHRVVRVFEGDSYRKRGEDEYSLAPELGREGYDALIRDLASLGRLPTQIVHLWLTSASEKFRPGSSFFHENLQNGFFSLFFLARAIAEETTPGDLHWTIVSNHMQAVLETDDVLYPEKSTVLGPALVIPREMPGFTCKTVDIELPKAPTGILDRFNRLRGRSDAANGLDEIVDRLAEEVLVRAENDIVAHRGRERYVRRFNARTLTPREAGTVPVFQDGATFLITGGIGGIGATLADRIAREVRNVHLVLVSRSPVPERSRWDGILSGNEGGTPRDRQVVRQIQALEATGASVLTIAADVTNPEEMRSGIQSARETFGPIDGIFHCAGIVDDELIQLKVDASIERVFGPKVHGTLVLDSLLEESGAKLLVLFSSTSALTGPTGQVDYVAANAFLDAYAQAHRHSSVRTVSVNWGIWNEVGLAARNLGSGDASTESEVDAELGAVSHPLFDVRSQDTHGRTGFVKSYSPQRDWIFEEHRTADDRALFPGSGYPELARAALAEYGEAQSFEIHDLYFLRPLHVPDGELRDVRVQLQPTDQGYRFSVRSKVRVEGRPAWVLTSEANLKLGKASAPAPLDLAAIDARCQVNRSSVNPLGHRSGQENHVRFGPRWRVLRQVLYGDGEALAHLELPDEFADDLNDYKLHPALLDYATGYAMELIPGYDPADSLWMPVSYGRIDVLAPLEKKISSLVRIRNSENGGDFASFDVTIMDHEGRVLIEIEDFTIKRVGNDVDFSDSIDETTADVEFEMTASDASDEDLSPAEKQLRRNYEAGILPSDGIEALLRSLSLPIGPQVVITSIDLEFLFNQANKMAIDAAPGSAKFERPDLDSEYIEPRDEIEKTLVALWEDMLGVDQLGIRDSFFDLGGHSLIAVRFFTKIKKTYRVDFPISVLFEAPTIEGCAELIREALGDSDDLATGSEEGSEESTKRKIRFKHLVAMDSGGGAGGANAPFFLVAGMFGNVLNLRHLAALVGTDRPFYGLQARGLYGDEQPHITFEEMASAYLEEIRTVQPTGPYYIGGFSGGGITAFEMAHQLLTEGEEVSMLVMLDSILPILPEISTLDRIKVQWIRLRRRGLGYAWEWARNRAKWQMEQIEIRRNGGVDPEQGVDEFHNVAIERAFRCALPLYQMKRFPGHLHLFRPALNRAYELGGGRVLNEDKQPIWSDNGWTQWVDSIEVSEMPGNHDSMVLEPNVRVMATKLRELLSKYSNE